MLDIFDIFDIGIDTLSRWRKGVALSLSMNYVNFTFTCLSLPFPPYSLE